MEQRLKQCVKVEKPLVGGKLRAKKGYIYFWTEDGMRWFRHNERAYRSMRQIRSLENKLARHFPEVKIKNHVDKHGELPDGLDKGGLPIKTFPLVFGDGRRRDHPRLEHLQKKIGQLEREKKELQAIVALTGDADFVPTDFVTNLGSNLVQEYTRPDGTKTLGMQIAGEPEIRLTRAQWQNMVEFQEVIVDALRKYGEHVKRRTLGYDRSAQDAPSDVHMPKN